MFIGIGLNLVRGGGSASPASLFAASEPGAWYDPSDLTTLFQDSAGATPVTAPNQTVGKILDKSGRGNHATQATLAQRPTYGISPIVGTRNLLTYTEQFENAYWTKQEVTIVQNAAAAPNGTVTADRLVPTAVSSTHQINRLSLVTSQACTIGFYLKASGLNTVEVLDGTLGVNGAIFDVSSGTVTNRGTGVGSMTSLPDGWYRCTLLVTTTGVRFYVPTSSPIFIGDGTSGIYIWGAQLELGSTATAYQKVVSQYEVTEAGVESASYISFDGVDDGMVTGTITPGIDKVQVFAGIRRISDANTGILAEFSPALGSNAGSWHMLSPAGSGVAGSGFASKGTVQAANNTVSPAAPITEVLTGIGDIAGDVNIFRKNGVATSVLTDQGTGNFLPYVLYIGRRGGTSLAMNSRIYSMLVRFGANLTEGQITATESWVNSKTGAF